MISEVNKHPLHYGLLGLGLSVGVVVILFFRFQPPIATAVTYSLGGFYLIWGIFHHATIGHLRFRVVLEYALVALLGTLIITTLL